MYSSAEVAGQTQGELAKVSRSEQVSFDRKGKWPLLFLLGIRGKVNTYKLPHGRPGMSDVSSLCGVSGLSFESTLPAPLLRSAYSCCSFCIVSFLAHSSDFFLSRKFFNILY